jgi:hypothetical protein
MPENLIHCQNCRALLNPELESDSVEIPEFIPLQEISTMVEAELRGYYVACPQCERELRINRKYKGERVSCNFCEGQFVLDINSPKVKIAAFYTACPHCSDELRAATKYLGTKVACKHCGGKIHFVGKM